MISMDKLRERKGNDGTPDNPLRLLVTLILATTTIASADMVKCKKPDGSLYIGPTPPEDCVPVGSARDRSSEGGGASWKPGEFLPTPTPAPSAGEHGKPEVEAARLREIEERRKAPAVVLQNMYNRLYSNGRFVEGTVANSASFPVYGVRICVEGHCDYTSPSTLQPGAQGTFQFPARRNYSFDEGSTWQITWDVLPVAEQ
jgi:hypothetical protein